MNRIVPNSIVFTIHTDGGMVVINRSSKSIPRSVLLKQPTSTSSNVMGGSEEKQAFPGERGEEVKPINDKVSIDTSDFEINEVKFYNINLTAGKNYSLARVS